MRIMTLIVQRAAHYLAIAYAAVGDIITGGEVTPPPTSLSISFSTYSSGTLSWVDSSSEIYVTGYKVFRDGVLLTTVPSSSVSSYTMNDFVENTSYNFSVLATGPNGDSVSVTTSGTTGGPSSNVTTDWENWIGTPFAADSLGNTGIGRSYSSKKAQRFLARYDGPITHVRPHYISEANSNYAAGNGGTIRMRIVPDDGNGMPNESIVLGEAIFEPGLVNGGLPETNTFWKTQITYPLIALSATLVAGQRYHLTYENIHADPANNFLGINSLIHFNTTDIGPRPSILDWGMTRSNDGDPWEEYTDYAVGAIMQPILELRQADGRNWGMGYIESYNGHSRPIENDNWIRTTFTADKTLSATQFWLRAWTVNSTGNLDFQLTGDDGSSESLSIPASAFVQAGENNTTNDAEWVNVPWSVQLDEGVEYLLTLTSSDGYFRAQAIRDGTFYSYTPNSRFIGITRTSDDAGATWNGWHLSTGNVGQIWADLQMAFRK